MKDPGGLLRSTEVARPWRIEFPGACYHVINRGNYRRDLFKGKGAAKAFERVLGEAAVRFDWEIHAYVVMGTHFHLAVRITEPNLSEGMKWLQGTWIRRYNSLRKLVGRPFQGRYHASLVEPGHAFSQVCHYIHLNPVRAKIVPMTRIAAFAWSSLHHFCRRNRPRWLVADTVLSRPQELSDDSEGWKRYLRYLEFCATDKQMIRELCHEQLSRGWCVGSNEFRQRMREEAKRRGLDLQCSRFAGLDAREVFREKRAAWEGRLIQLAAMANIDLEKLTPKKSHPQKVLLASALKQISSVSNGWLASRLQMGRPNSASKFVQRWLITPAGKAQTERLLSRVLT